ncbi:phospholipase/carboxylesterase [Tistrella bauzanensis]|uniref:Phospholipase/carboxylesterase n=1 Tax=Tistrella bauzanensis TaxID=657419 RepID=A0ABQ1J830_9PROT|nr:prolyl oligopeptidase family serine peptidase [Tistrella bauzanensis]GGB59804.1 phospholipase/carboxylesterase [Tistrella bauzanensis]
MTAQPGLTGPELLPPDGTVRRVVVFLHGYGADGQDLIGLAPFFAQVLPGTAFYAPDAPEPCEMSPFGRQWFGLDDYDPDLLRREPANMAAAHARMAAGVARSAGPLRSFLAAALETHDLAADRLALIGFSQGTMMALGVGLALNPAPAAIVGFSGALLGPVPPVPAAATRPAVLLIHGAADPVVPVEASGHAAAKLKDAGIAVDVLRRPGLAHGIDQAGAEAAAAFLVRHLPG